MTRRLAIAAACGLVIGPAAGGTPAQAAPTFTTRIDNSYLPMSPGSRWVYRETALDGTKQRVVVKVTHRTKLIANGVTARVVRDTVTEKSRVVEDTFDWYAQDTDGNVWYLGEDSKEIENGQVVSTQGSWEWGVGGALPGIIMWADPAAHMNEEYRQEYLKGVAEDLAKVVALDASAQVPAGSYSGCLKTQERNALEPNSTEFKYYCDGVGTVLETNGSRDEIQEVTGP